MAANLEAVMLDAEDYANKVRDSLPVDKIYLFGSYAKGTATELSDVDITVFFTNFQEKTRSDFELLLLKFCRGHRSYFEPLAFERADLYDDNPLVNEILRTGLEYSQMRNTLLASDLPPLPATSELLRVARRVVWFQEPEEALSDPVQEVSWEICTSR